MRPPTPELFEIEPLEIQPDEIHPDQGSPDEIEPSEIRPDRGGPDRESAAGSEPDRAEPDRTEPDPRQVVRTTVYLPNSLVAGVRAIAAHRSVSSAAIIRAAVESAVGSHRPPPRGGFL
jgi:Ribbon-helix-helix protein, copG family